MPSFKVMQLCGANAMRDERVEAYRYGNRHDQLVQFVSEQQPDILSIKELRKCRDASGKVRHPSYFLSDYATEGNLEIGGFDAVKQHETIGIETFNPFYLAILFNPNMFIKRSSHAFWYYEEVFGVTSKPHCGTMMLSTMFEYRDEPGQFLLIEACHAPLMESDKLKFSEWIRDVYPDERRSVFGALVDECKIIRTGDFNTFWDKPDAQQQYDNYAVGLVDVSKIAPQQHHFDPSSSDIAQSGDSNDVVEQDSNDNIPVYGTSLDDENIQVYGTFYPFPHDIIPAFDIAFPTVKSKSVSCLDYMFCRELGVSKIQFKVPDRNTDIIPLGDHLPMIVTFTSD